MSQAVKEIKDYFEDAGRSAGQAQSGRGRHELRLPRQAAAVCYRRKNSRIQFLLVTTKGGKWTFAKGSIAPGLSESHAAAREAYEEAGALGIIEPRPFHSYLHSKGVFWKKGGVQEFLVRAFLMEIHTQHPPLESDRNPRWYDPTEAKRLLAINREHKYAEELAAVIDAALERLNTTNGHSNGNGR